MHFNFLNKSSKMFVYEILIPPFNYTPDKMTPLQAQKYFDWFVEKVPERVQYLSETCSKYANIPLKDIDLSPESLIHIWKWFISIAKIENTPQNKLEEYKTSLAGMPESFILHMLNDSSFQFSLLTLYIIRDIGMYLGQVFVKNYENLNWGFYTKPKKDIFVNQAVILGFEDKNFTPIFKPNFEPIHMISVQASNLFDKTANKNDLYHLFKKWEMYV